MHSNDLSNEAIQPELYFLIAHFLNNSQFEDVAKILIQQLEQKNVLPKRVDWTGKEHPRTYEELANHYKHIPGNFLLQTQNQLRLSLDKLLQNKFLSVNTLLGSGQYSLLQNLFQIDKKIPKNSNFNSIPKDTFLNYHASNKNSYNLSKSSLNGGTNLLLNLNKRQLNHKLETSSIIQPELFRSVNSHIRILGHLSAVYCVCFDRTGRYILTGADDHLIKAWCAYDGRLMATFRGHQKEISDIDINYENTLVASGSCDKTIRIWNLKTTESTTILQGHTAMVTSVEFSPICRGEDRWLASSSNDGYVCFWNWNAKTLSFNPKAKRFNEKTRPGGQILCLSFSAGGSFLAAGSNDHAIRVYFFDNGTPIKICELESHTNIVDSIQYANNSARFLSGSKDGTARIWQYESQKWRALLIDGSKTLQKPDHDELSLMDIHKKYGVTMVTWNSDDSLVATAQSNFLIKIWNSNDAELVHELKHHTAEIFVLEAHPRDPRLLLSAGHDGFVILWNILTGKMIKRFYNRIENEGHGCLFDTKWSPNFDMFAATDSHGYLTMYGFGNGERYLRVPREQFFHSDYRPLMHDLNGFAVDEQTQQAPHLMPPPFLVNADGNPYPAEYQRLVPGRENLTDAQLTPHTILNENGVAEIIGDRGDEDENEPSEEQQQQQQRQRNRFRDMWVKDLIRPLDMVTLATNESLRLSKLDVEEDYFVTEYKKELQANESNKNSSKDHDYSNSNLIKRAGRPSNKRRTNDNGIGSVIGDIVIKNNPTSRALYDSDNEESSRPAAMEYDEDTLDDQYIDVDDDSNTQMSSNAINNIISNHQQPSRSTSNRANNTASNNNNNNNNNNNYIDPMDLASETESSEYSDWAEEDGRRTLKPPPRKATTTTRQQRAANRRTRRQLRVMDDDEDNINLNEEEDINPEEDESKVTRKSKRKSKKVLTSDDEDNEQNMDYDTKDIDEEGDEEEENDNDEDDDYSSDEDDFYNDENMDPNKPCTSHSANLKNGKIPKKRGRKSKSSTTTTTANKPKYAAKASKLNDLSISSISKSSKTTTKTVSKSSKLNKSITNECPIEYRPPEWLTSTKPRKSPYFPQIGDEVVYFRQGHELYVKAVRDNKVYDLDEKSIPWLNNKSSKINVQEFCRVMGIKIEIKPPRLVCLKLAVIDRATGKQTGFEFQIKYHDMPHVVDFVILKQYYDRGIEKKWKEKDKFRCIIDDVWWFGSIESRTPFQPEYPDSQFQCLKVLWENGQIEEFSPWDLEPISGVNGRKTKPVSSNIGESMAVTIDDIKSLLYVPETEEWPDDRDTECERILKGLEQIMELSLAEYFNYPVDLDSFPLYAVVISYPIDLNTIKERIENRYYRRLNALQWDVRKIAKNASDFNKANSEIVQKANILTELILEFINDPHCTNPMPIYKRLFNNKNLTLCEEEMSLGEDEDTETANNNNNKPKTSKSNDLYDNENEEDDFEKGKSSKGSIKGKSSKETSTRSSHKNQSSNSNNKLNKKSSNKSKSFSWKEECKELLNNILKHPDSEPFRTPVDLTLYPDYLESVDEPIDFKIIKERLLNNEYGDDLNRFDKDCRLLFQNSKSYNTNKRSKIYGMTVRLQALYESRVKEILDNYKRSINYETSKYGRLRKFRYTDNEIYGNEAEETTVKVKSTKQKLRNDIEPTINGNNTRSSSRRSTRQTNNLFSHFNENSNQSHHNYNNNTNNEDESNVNSFEQDNIEYDLNNDINPNENENNESKIVNNNNNDELASAIQPCTSRTSLKSSLKNRVSRADSETNLSYNDAIESSSIINNQCVEYFDDNANDANNTKKKINSKLSKSKKSYEENNDDNDKLDETYESDGEEQETINKEKASASKTSKRGRKKRKKSGEEETDQEYNIKNEDVYDEEEEHDDSDDTDFDVDDLDDEDYTDRKTSNNKHKKSSKRLNSHNANSNHGNSNNHSDYNKKNKSLKRKSINNLLDNKENNNESDYQVINNKYSKSNSVKSISKKSSSSSSNATRTSKRLRKKFHYKEVTSSDDDEEDDETEEGQNNASNNVGLNDYSNTTEDEDDDYGSNENSNQRTRLSRNSRKKFKVK